MARASWRRVIQWAPALLAAACLFSAAPASAQFFGFWSQPERPRPAPQALSPGQVRAVLAREGARLIGAPHLRGGDIVAIGRDEIGDRKRFTLDALTGEVLDITVIARHEDRPPPAPAPIEPATPLPPPEHAPHGPDAAQGAGAAPAAPPPAAAAPAPRQDPADAALSPIKPLKPAGAPKVEPLPR